MDVQIDKGDRARDMARRRTRAVRRFHTHVWLYLTVNAALLMVNILTPGSWWFLWPLLIWGIAVVAHAVQVFVLSDAAGARSDRKTARPPCGC